MNVSWLLGYMLSTLPKENQNDFQFVTHQMYYSTCKWLVMFIGHKRKNILYKLMIMRLSCTVERFIYTFYYLLGNKKYLLFSILQKYGFGIGLMIDEYVIRVYVWKGALLFSHKHHTHASAITQMFSNYSNFLSRDVRLLM